MILPHPKASYTQRDEVERNRQLEQAERNNHKRGQDVEIGTARLILTSPDGTRYSVRVDNAGGIYTETIEGLELSNNPAVTQAEAVVLSTYGDTVSVAAKGKNLNKFGRNLTVGTSYETVAELQGTTANETFVTTNIIDSISSSSTSDTTQTIRIEGHTIDGSGNLTFVVQEAALNGRTKVTLATPLARATRANVKETGTFGTEPAALVGTVSIYDDTDGISAGVPNTDAATKLTILPGDTQTEKASTTISAGDYWFISYFSAGIGDSGKSADYITIRMETRDVVNGGAWRPMSREVVLATGAIGRTIEFDPYLIVPKNHDWRIRAKTDANTAEVFAEAGGVLALIQ